MGQKISSIGDALSWRNADSSKIKENPNEYCPRAHGLIDYGPIMDTLIPPIKCSFKDDNDMPSDIISVDYDHTKCCNASMANVETTSKNTQTTKTSSKKLHHWASRLSSKPKSKNSKCYDPPESVPESNEVQCETCLCRSYLRSDIHHLGTGIVYDDAQEVPVEENEEEETMSQEIPDFDGAFNAFNAFDHHSELVLPSFDEDIMDLHSDMTVEFINDDFEDRAYRERAKEIQEGIEPPPGFKSGLHMQLLEFNLPKMTIDNITTLFHRAAITAFNTPQDTDDSHRVHTSIDYIHYLVPDLLQITNCSFYWGKMDRYEAERLLESRPEGTFLLRDSAQEEYLFSVSFRKYGRSLHARIEQWNHLFSFDSRDPGVFASKTVCGLIEHYKDPTCCMFFEPMLTIPLNRNFTFSLQHTARATICSDITYDDVHQLKLPKLLKSYLKEYHYKQRVRVRIFD